MAANAGRRVDPTVDARSPSVWRSWLEQLGRNEQARLAEFGVILVGGFVAAALLLYAFAWLATEVLEQDTQAIDMGTLNFLQRFSSPQLTWLAQGVSLMGSQVVIALGAALLVVFFWQRRWGAAVSLILVTAGAQLLNDVLKEAFHRARPVPVAGFVDAQQFSFPSGHAMVSAAFYLYLAYLSWRLVRSHWRRTLMGGALVVLVLLIGLSRLYLEAHYLSDVIAGYLAGVLWTDSVVLGGQVLALRTQPRPPTVVASAPEAAGPPPPPPP
ncbi:MAG: phosphatase PAP2 family protein [Chloroflexi bacterium]|nr:phosphatase PAP2 family protein [Chloroflexota bacterium]MBV9134149.1 phosphatase PAP2 family protein [Chloroflexota bacterium]